MNGIGRAVGGLGVMSGLLDDEWHEKLPPICAGCGYNLTGVSSRRCPECGQQINWSELKQKARTVYHSLRQLEDVNDILGVGVYLGAGGAGLMLLLWLVGWGGLGRVLGMLVGIATFGTGIQVFRVRQFPEWAGEFIRHKPNCFKAVGVILTGMALIALAIL